MGWIVGTLFDLEDDGVFLMDDHAVPGAGLDIDEAGAFFFQHPAVLDLSGFGEEEDFELTLEEANGLGGVGLGVAVGLDVGAGLEEVGKALDAGFLAALDGKNDALAGAGA